MSEAYRIFDARLKKIDRNRARLADGYVSKVGRDGLVIFRPRRRQAGFPIRALLLLVVGFFCFKGIVMAHTGSTVYEERVATLQNGTTVEQIGAFVMQVDPVTKSIATKVRPFLK